MQTQSNKHELLSALVDGELAQRDIEQTLALCDHEGHVCWQTYHLIGDVLREPALARRCDSNKLLDGVRQAMQQDQRTRAMLQEQSAPVAADKLPAASNDSVFRWKMVAGLASMAAVAALGWNSFNQWDAASGTGAQMATAAPPVSTTSVASGAPAAASLQAATSPQVMMRDPRLDELLAAHQQYGRANALQMPAGFLRNATFDTPQK